MPDRIIRNEILESDRWLDLPSDTDRLAFVGLVLIADDYGNLRGGLRRMFRLLHRFTQIKTEENATTVMIHLVDADLVRRYEIEGKEFWHIPRFRSQRWYWARAVPGSQWDEKHEQTKNQRVTKKIDAALQQPCINVAEGVGVGVGVGVELKPFASTEISVDANGAWIGITDRDRKVWANAYPAIVVNVELDKAMAWVIANPKNRKKNWRRFLVNWLARSQEKAPTAKPKPGSKEDMSWLV